MKTVEIGSSLSKFKQTTLTSQPPFYDHRINQIYVFGCKIDVWSVPHSSAVFHSIENTLEHLDTAHSVTHVPKQIGT